LYLLLLLFLPLFLTLVAHSTPVKADPNVTTNAEPYYLVSGDIIRNFKFETINGESIDPGGGAYDNRLKFEMEPIWQIRKGDLELLQAHKVGNKMYYQYKLPFTTDLNVYTNVRLEDASETIQRSSKNYLAAAYLHYPKGSSNYDSTSWRKDLTYYYYDFWVDSNLRDYNKRNKFSGDLVMSFDIDDSPLPNSLTDENGNTLVKQFDYVGISSAAVIDGTHGPLSQAPPEIHYSTPDYETSPVVDVSGENPSPGYIPQPGSHDEGYKSGYSFQTGATIRDAGVETYSPGIQYTSTNASLNPTTKDGSDIFDNVAETKQSQKDCKIYYNIGSLAPTIYEYYARLDWTSHVVACKEKAIFVPTGPLGMGVDIPYKEWTYGEEQYSKVKSSALHVQNNFIQCTIQIVLNFYLSYEIQVLDTPEYEDYDLEQPQEYYENNTWQTVSDGAVSGEYTEETESPFGDLENPLEDWDPFGNIFDPEATSEWFNNVFMLLILVVVIIGVVVVLVIVIRFARPRPKGYHDSRVVR